MVNTDAGHTYVASTAKPSPVAGNTATSAHAAGLTSGSSAKAGFWQTLLQGGVPAVDWDRAAITAGVKAAEILLLYLAARVAIRFGSRAVGRLLRSPAVRMQPRRRDTMESLLDNVLRYLVYFIFILMALQTMGVRIETLLAGAGIAGLALGFGAQSLIRDVLTGFFILFEDQYAVGDLVKINNVTGTVKTIGLRLTRLQVWTGEIEIIPNGQIQQITNYSRENAVAVIDVPVSYREDTRRAMDVMGQVLEEMRMESDDIVGDVKVLGIHMLRDNDILLRATAVCRPTRGADVQREAVHRIIQAFAREQIALR
ncbi:mechanosensitive ion channel protein MscS [Alicyclobacillus cellulosilyticus]|uniref:Mechanosensitive ion channel protein MscS n=2 Tax=Alicyclobacillus cellulosilyticus TaxID=1003997 RepID=A0A917K0Q8_9BACL|nr:mechanosensitive ion channel protein MscS [Alicyclobacillus cellulosilyticus]